MKKTGTGAAALTFVILVMVSWFGIRQTLPPAAVPASAPPREFSAERALEHIRTFAQRPHPVGSAEHDLVRDYIVTQLVALGIQPQVETATSAMDGRWGFPLSAARVTDIIARIPGTASTRALALVAHYDSVASGPGASDDGEGVAVLLETLRALRAGPPLRNDLIFLFTDGEEAGLLGAKSFVEAHPHDAGLVLDFEARGTSGPAFMFETSEGNGWMVRQLAAAAPYPQANSLSYEAYRNMPNDTDLTIFKKAGIAGLNFAFIGDVTDYHTALDDPLHIDPRSLQHQGSYALPLAQRFGNLDLGHVTAGNVTYFNLPLLGMVIYPIEWSLPLALLAGLLLVAVIALGLVRRSLMAGRMVLGFAFSLVASIVCAALAMGLWRLVLLWHPEYRQMLQGDPYHAGFFRAATVALIVAVFVALYNLVRRRIASLFAGALLLWLLLAILTARSLPGASYVFTWPLVCGIVGLACLVFRPVTPILWICAVPILIMIPPVIDQLFVAMTMRMAVVPALILGLLLGLLIPYIELIVRPRPWWLALAATMVCIVCLIAGSAAARFDGVHPKPDSLFYGLDADNGKATWFSGDFQPDPWTAPALGPDPRRVSGSPFVPYLTWSFFVNQAPAAPLPAPWMEQLQDTVDVGARSLRLHVVSRRQAPVIFVYGDPEVQVLSAEVNGKPIGAGMLAPADKPGLNIIRFHRWSFNFANPGSEGIEVHMRLKGPASPLHMEVVDQSYGLAGSPNPPLRPAGTIPLPWTPDSIYVSKSYVF